MKKMFIGLFMIAGFLPLVSALAENQEADTTRYEIKLEEGIEAFYQTDWTRAKSIFRDLKSADPDDSRAYFFSSMIPFWSYYFGDSSEKAAQKFMSLSQEAIEISRQQLKRNPGDTTMVLMLSGLYGYQSLVAASEKHYQQAVQSGAKGFKYSRQLLSLDANDPKALIGKGIFYYMIGSVPNGMKWVTNMVGFSGNSQEGFSALKIAAASESYVSNDAKMILAYLYEREKQPRKALAYLKELTNRYPENIIFQYNMARLYEKCGMQQEALQKYQVVISLDNVSLQALKDKSRSRLQSL